MRKFIKYGAIAVVSASMLLTGISAIAENDAGSTGRSMGDTNKDEHGLTSQERDALKAQRQALLTTYSACRKANKVVERAYKRAITLASRARRNATETAQDTMEDALFVATTDAQRAAARAAFKAAKDAANQTYKNAVEAAKAVRKAGLQRCAPAITNTSTTTPATTQ